jgi:hypothetical protein
VGKTSMTSDPRLDLETAEFSDKFKSLLEKSKIADYSGLHVHSPIHIVGKDYEGRQTVLVCPAFVNTKIQKELVQSYLFNKIDPIVCASFLMINLKIFSNFLNLLL